MPRLVFTPMPKPPLQYSPQYQETFVRILQQTFRKVNYSTEQDSIVNRSMTWMGF